MSTTDMTWLLTKFIDETPGVTATVLASDDGLATAWVGVGRDDADRWAAVLATMESSGVALGALFSSGTVTVEQQLVEITDSVIVIQRVGASALLSVRTDPEGLSNVTFRMSELAVTVGEHLGLPVRGSVTR